MKIAGIIVKHLDIKPAEEHNFRLLFVQSLLTGFSTSFFFVVCSSYFIKLIKIANLPSAYIFSGILGYLLVSLYKLQQRKNGIGASFITSLFAYAVTAIALYTLHLSVHDERIVRVLAYVGFMFIMPFSTILALGFSTVCVKIFNIAQSKRLLALIGTGEVIASIAAYLLVPVLSKFIAPVHLLLFSAITTLAAIIPLRKIYAHNKENLDQLQVIASVKKFDMSFFTKNKYYSLIALATLLSIIAVFFTDYSYLISVRYINLQTGYESAAIVALIFSVIKTGELTFSLLSGKIIRSLGMKYSLVLLPWLLIFFSFMAFMSGLSFPDLPFFLLVFLLMNKWCERVIRKGVMAPAMKILFQVAPKEDRVRLQTSIDGTLTQVASIFSGVLLLILSYVFKGLDNFDLLKVIAVICLVLFILWGWTTNNLYAYYRSVIIDFLNKLNTGNAFAAKTNEQQKTADTGKDINKIKDSASQAIIDKLMNETLDKKTLFEYLSYYNKSLKSTTNNQQITFAQLTRLYNNNENFFNRLLIIWYLQYLPAANMLDFFKEMYSVSDKELRVQMLAALNRSGYNIPAEDVFYMTNLCQEVVAEIIWAEAAIRDIAGNNQLLEKQLDGHVQIMTGILFEFLKLLYDKSSMQMIQDIIMAKRESAEDHLFALELLDISLDPVNKKWILPVFEDISFAAKKARLKEYFAISNYPYEARLKEMMMKDFKLIGSEIKQSALESYYKSTNDVTALNAFASSSIENLNGIASSLKNEGENHVFFNKRKIAELIDLENVLKDPLLSYFMRWGVIQHSTKPAKHNYTYQLNPDYLSRISIDNLNFSVDLLGMSLFLKLQNTNNTI